MDTTTVALVFFLGGSTVLCLSLKLFKIDFKMWQPVLASLAAALCVMLEEFGDAFMQAVERQSMAG